MKRWVWFLMGLVLLFTMTFTTQTVHSLPKAGRDGSWNLAFKQPVQASGYDKGFLPEYAVDGLYDPFLTPPQCWVRSDKGGNWIEITFPAKAKIERIELLLGRGAPGLQFEAWARLSNGKLDSLGSFAGKPDINGVLAFDIPKPRGGVAGVRIGSLDPGFPCIHEIGLIGRFPHEEPPGDIPSTVACLASPDVIFYNGMVITMNSLQPTAEAVAIEGERIIVVGSNATILPMAVCTTLIDLGRRTIMPGFVDAHTHALTDSSLGSTVAQRQAALLENGITTIGVLYTDRPFFDEMQAIKASGGVHVRTSLYLIYNTNCGEPVGTWYTDFRRTDAWGEMLRIGGVKIFSDGGSCRLPAFSFEIAPGEYGDLFLTGIEMADLIRQAETMGYQVAVHAIGDRAIQNALDAIEMVLDGAPNMFRHRIEHNSVIDPSRYPRYGDLGIVPVISSEFPSCEPFGEPSPEPYREWEWPYVGLQGANPGLHMAWGGDYAGDSSYSLSPFIQLYSFVTRNDVVEATGEVCPPAPWLADDIFPVEQALRFMTMESAYALFREDEVGSLESGKLADLIVVSDNPLTVDSNALKDIDVLMTMVGGRTEYCAPGTSPLCP